MPAARIAFLLALLSACSLFGGGHAETPRAPASPFGTFQRVSDADPILDVAVGREHVWVATTHGLVRHALTGTGEPTRIGENEGLPAPEVTAVVAGANEGWAATTFGLVRLTANGVERVADTPEVGVPTAMAIDHEGAVWVGGAQGFGRGKDGRWERWSNRHKVTALAADGSGLWIGTQDSGLVHLAGGVLTEHTIAIGLPSNFVRSVVPLGQGQALVLCHSPSGGSLAYWDGTRWYPYTAPGIEEPMLGLAVVGGHPQLYTASHVYSLEKSDDAEGSELVGLPGGGEGAPRQFRPRPEPVDPGGTVTTPPPTAASPAATPRSSKQEAAPAAPDPMSEPLAPSAPASPDVAMPHREALPAPLAPLPPPDEQVEAPRWVLRDAGVSPGASIAFVRGHGDALWVATVGLGVVRWQDGRETSYRARDLATTAGRPFFLGWDAQGNSWTLSRGRELVRYDGVEAERVTLDPDPEIQPLATAAGAGAVYVLARRADTNVFRIYRGEGGALRSVAERELVAGAGIADVSAFGVDGSGRFWIGLKAKTDRGSVVERGVAVVDPNAPVVTYHHSRAAAETDGPGALRIPDSVSAIAFGGSGEVWLAGLEGAVRISDGQVRRFGEAQGLEGELVGDLDIGPGNVPTIATPSGIGRFEGGGWRFDRSSVVTQAHPLGVAVDGQGHVWAGGPHGAVYGDGRAWKRIATADGLLDDRLSDVAVDGNNRVWFVSAEGLTILARH